MLDSEKQMTALDEAEAAAKAELERIGREKASVRGALVKEKLALTAALSDKLFKDIFQGEVAKDFEKLAAMTAELYRLDAKFDNRLASDRYGLPESYALRFYTQFVAVALFNSRGLSDIIGASKKHSDNPYLHPKSASDVSAQ